MKILLLGEFSSLHRYLKEGLTELGHEVTLGATGDGWKKIGGADFSPFAENSRSYPERCLKQLLGAKKLTGYDVCQFINVSLFALAVRKRIIKRVHSGNSCLSLCACGGDLALVRAYNNKCFDYFAYDYDKSVCRKYDSKSFRGRMLTSADNYLTGKADVIIPSMFEYAQGYKGSDRLYDVIPLPINTSGIGYSDNILRGKLVIFHGINNELGKGTPFIREAMERLKEKYPDDVEIIMEGHLPFDEYVKLMSRTNVVIDQCCGYSYGINACIALAQGKVVLTGARPEAMKLLGGEETPIFMVKPDSDQIFSQLEYILKNKERITEWGRSSREYVERVHNNVNIAGRYVKAWQSAIERRKSSE